jgi:hypothetical protein
MFRRGIVLRWRPAEMSVTVYQSTRSHIPTDCMLVCACVLPIAMQWTAAHCACQTAEFCSRTAVATTADVADSTEVRKWKCLFGKGSECKRPINAAMECFNPCQNVTNASLCLGIMLTSDGVSVEQMSCICLCL